MQPAILGILALVLPLLGGLLGGVGAGQVFCNVLGMQGAKRLLVVLAVTVSGGLLGTFVGIVEYSEQLKGTNEARRGWNLVPVVVAAVDVEPGEVLTFDMISQRSIPEQFVTDDVVKPDSAAYIVNQKVAVALAAGDLVMWNQFCAVTPATDRTP